jgi:hypothetical protein
MATLRIYDYDNGVLAVDLRHLLDLLAPRSLEATWTVTRRFGVDRLMKKVSNGFSPLSIKYLAGAGVIFGTAHPMPSG